MSLGNRRGPEQCADGVQRRGDPAAQIGRVRVLHPGAQHLDEPADQKPADRVGRQAGDGGDSRHAVGGDLLARGREFGAERGDDPQCDRTRHDVAVHRPVLSGEIEESQDAGARIACDIRSRRSEGDGERVRDGVVAVPEVLVEDLATDLGASDDVADRQLVDRTLVCQRERRVPKPGADAFGAGIDTVRACCHIRSVDHFVDK